MLAAPTSLASPSLPIPRNPAAVMEEVPKEQADTHPSTSVLAKTRIQNPAAARATTSSGQDAAVKAGHGAHRHIHQGEAGDPPHLHTDHTVTSMLENHIN